MADIGREKVIKGLECCFNPHSENSCLCHCSECPYDSQDDNNWTQNCQIKLNKDALKLLKKQEQAMKEKDGTISSLIAQIKEISQCYERVVRCKDCKNWIPGYITDKDDFIPPKCGKYQQMVGHSNDDFCSLAEKKEGR